MILRMTIAAAALALLAAPCFAADALLAAAVASSQRSPANVARDGARHPAASLAFWGLKPGQTVIEVAPGGGYWSEILAPYAKATGGHYIAATEKPGDRLPARFADKAVYGDIHYTVFGKSAGPRAAPGSADLVLTARNVHNWMAEGFDAKAFADFYAALKPGGILAVEEHRADPKPMLPGASNGYVSTAHVVALAQKAGFTLEAKSEINANPKDTKDHPFGVWTLPPTRRSVADDSQPPNPAFDHGKYDAIGESDRMTLRFRKPG